MINWEWLLLACCDDLSELQLHAPQLCAPPCATLNALALAAKSPSVTSCGSTKESALRKRMRVELAIA